VVVLGEIEDMVLLREFKRLGRCTGGELVVFLEAIVTKRQCYCYVYM
jgi:hypothetical protein